MPPALCSPRYNSTRPKVEKSSSDKDDYDVFRDLIVIAIWKTIWTNFQNH